MGNSTHWMHSSVTKFKDLRKLLFVNRHHKVLYQWNDVSVQVIFLHLIGFLFIRPTDIYPQHCNANVCNKTNKHTEIYCCTLEAEYVLHEPIKLSIQYFIFKQKQSWITLQSHDVDKSIKIVCCFVKITLKWTRQKSWESTASVLGHRRSHWRSVLRQPIELVLITILTTPDDLQQQTNKCYTFAG